MSIKFIILGCGSSLGVPRIDGFFGNCDPKSKKNEPSYIKYTLQKLSELKSLNFDDLEEITNNNFEKLFS